MAKQVDELFEVPEAEEQPAKKQNLHDVNKTLPTKREREFREAVERVYRKYGRDLSAFLRDIQKEKELLKKG